MTGIIFRGGPRAIIVSLSIHHSVVAKLTWAKNNDDLTKLKQSSIIIMMNFEKWMWILKMKLPLLEFATCPPTFFCGWPIFGKYGGQPLIFSNVSQIFALRSFFAVSGVVGIVHKLWISFAWVYIYSFSNLFLINRSRKKDEKNLILDWKRRE